MIGQILNGRYRVLRKLKEAREGKIYYVVEDQQNGKFLVIGILDSSLPGNELRMLKGIGLLEEKEERDANLEINLLRQLGTFSRYILHLFQAQNLTFLIRIFS